MGIEIYSKNIVFPKKFQVEMDESGKHGKFTVYPLQKGFGVTVGNILRRTMLAATPMPGDRCTASIHLTEILAGPTVRVVFIRRFISIPQDWMSIHCIGRCRSKNAVIC